MSEASKSERERVHQLLEGHNLGHLIGHVEWEIAENPTTIILIPITKYARTVLALYPKQIGPFTYRIRYRPNKEKVAISLSPSEFKRLKALAAKNNMPVQSYVGELIRRRYTIVPAAQAIRVCRGFGLSPEEREILRTEAARYKLTMSEYFRCVLDLAEVE